MALRLLDLGLDVCDGVCPIGIDLCCVRERMVRNQMSCTHLEHLLLESLDGELHDGMRR